MRRFLRILGTVAAFVVVFAAALFLLNTNAFAPAEKMLGVDNDADVARVPNRLDGYVWTNRAEAIAPAIAVR